MIARLATLISDHLFLLKSSVIWAILLISVFCYGLLIELCFLSKPTEAWYDRSHYWSDSLRKILAALPLLGLLGTITGLLKTFLRMSVEKGLSLQEIVSGGIAEAMFTTQMGLIMVVPGLLMLAYLVYKQKQWSAKNHHEIND